MRLNGSEILMQCLSEQKVDTIFGFPGGAVLNIFDALYGHKEIRHILTSHEQGASHAADGYARATGKTGVCLATSGPGATNLVTGIATAYMDSVPMVAITGQVGSPLLGKNSFQEVDITAITKPVTKANFIVTDIATLADTVRKAFYLAQHGRKGPVLIDVCKDVTAAEYEYTPQTPKEEPTAGCEGDFALAARKINDAKRPLIVCGGGVGISGAQELLAAFADKTGIPVTSTLLGLGCFDGTHPNFTGLLGMHGTPASNMAVSNADLLIVLGSRLSDRVTSDTTKFAPDATVIHIDIDKSELSKNIGAHIEITGDLKVVLPKLTGLCKKQGHKEWLDYINKYKTPYLYSNAFTAPCIVRAVYEKTKGDAIITTEVGQNQIWTAQHYPFHKPRTFLSSGGLGTMGYGLGAAIGAKCGMPEKTVINMAGDGSFIMNCNELATAHAYGIKVIQIILNNGVLGMVRQWQNLFYGKRFAGTTLSERGTNFDLLGQAFGVESVTVSNMEAFRGALERAIQSEGPSMINCVIDKDEMVYPIVPPGKGLEELIAEDSAEK